MDASGLPKLHNALAFTVSLVELSPVGEAFCGIRTPPIEFSILEFPLVVDLVLLVPVVPLARWLSIDELPFILELGASNESLVEFPF